MKYFFSIIIILHCFSSCDSCSNSGRRNRIKTNINQRGISNQNEDSNRNEGSSIVKITQNGGVYYIPAEINGVEMEFIFDTGASDITMSATEALFLYKQGKLKDEDFSGSQQYITADGTISEGTIIVLRTVKIGNKTLYNVKASIVHNLKAPLLLGQSALSQFGKITIDYNRNELRFE